VRILFDTNLLVRAAITPGGLARKLLRLVEKNDSHVIIVSAHLLSEVADVLRRPRIQERWPLTHEDVESFCGYLSRVAEEVAACSLPIAINDPKDQAVIEAAIIGRAEVICTFDTHFYQSPAKEFLKTNGILVVNDRDLLTMLTE
jgi:putative PIN family toxin of toxin-antitoxin system